MSLFPFSGLSRPWHFLNSSSTDVIIYLFIGKIEDVDDNIINTILDWFYNNRR